MSYFKDISILKEENPKSTCSLHLGVRIYGLQAVDPATRGLLPTPLLIRRSQEQKDQRACRTKTALNVADNAATLAHPAQPKHMEALRDPYPAVHPDGGECQRGKVHRAGDRPQGCLPGQDLHPLLGKSIRFIYTPSSAVVIFTSSGSVILILKGQGGYGGPHGKPCAPLPYLGSS